MPPLARRPVRLPMRCDPPRSAKPPLKWRSSFMGHDPPPLADAAQGTSGCRRRRRIRAKRRRWRFCVLFTPPKCPTRPALLHEAQRRGCRRKPRRRRRLRGRVTTPEIPARFSVADRSAGDVTESIILAVQLHDQVGLVRFAPPELAVKPLRPLGRIGHATWRWH